MEASFSERGGVGGEEEEGSRVRELTRVAMAPAKFRRRRRHLLGGGAAPPPPRSAGDG